MCPLDTRHGTAPHGTARQDRPASKSFVSGSGFGEFYSALVGDAAHPSRPSFGQGANMALEDAVQLGLVLREAGSVRGLSETCVHVIFNSLQFFGYIRCLVSRSRSFLCLIYTICTML